MRNIDKLILMILGIALVSSTMVAADTFDMVLNEWNCVGDDKYLDDPAGSDSYFGRIQGNGGNWVELLVLTDRLDIRGWTCEWKNSDPDSGSITFSNADIWSDLGCGTIITIQEDGLASDISYNPDPTNPMGSDWWIHADVDDDMYINESGFKVDNDDWEMKILDVAILVEDWTGENGATGVVHDTDGGVNSKEIGALGKHWSQIGSAGTNDYADEGKTSTFGSANLISERWSYDQTSDVSGLRGTSTIPEPATVALLGLGCLSLLSRRGRTIKF